ncbi:hypothetical protein DWW55_10330 [Paraprevotella clara]|nr:hypothetical protein DWW55_10330 [Paraprevotella clara]
MCFLGYFEYIYSRFSLVFHVSKVFLGISFSQMIFRSAEKTLFFCAGLFVFVRISLEKSASGGT